MRGSDIFKKASIGAKSSDPKLLPTSSITITTTGQQRPDVAGSDTAATAVTDAHGLFQEGRGDAAVVSCYTLSIYEYTSLCLIYTYKNVYTLYVMNDLFFIIV